MVFMSALTVGWDPDDGEDEFVFRRVAVVNAERRVGDDDAGVFLNMNAADGNRQLRDDFTLQEEIREKMRRLNPGETEMNKPESESKFRFNNQFEALDDLPTRFFTQIISA